MFGSVFGDNSFDSFNRRQTPNQFNSGNQTDLNANTRWMTPSNMSEPPMQPSQQAQPRFFATSGQPVNANIGSSSTPQSGTAIDSVLFNGSYNGNTGVTGYGSNWNNVGNTPNTNQTSQPPAQTPVTLPGWDSSRTDDSPKYVFGRFAQNWINSGKPWSADAVKAFVAQDPRWEIDPASSPDDPRIRVKQDVLNTWKPGTSIYQDVIRDSGPGGANAPQFLNAIGDPSMGYEAPGSVNNQQSVLGTGSSTGIDQAGLSQLIQRLFQQSQNQRQLMSQNPGQYQNYNLPAPSSVLGL